MSLRIIFTPIARLDIVDTTHYLAEHSMDAAVRFFDCVRQSAKRLSEMPELGTVVHLEGQRTKNIRIWPVKGFPNHLIFYQVETEVLDILRILHGSTDYETFFHGP